MTRLKICRCKQCKKQRRRGLILGARLTQGWCCGKFQGTYRVSDYVPFRKFAKGRARKERPLSIELD